MLWPSTRATCKPNVTIRVAYTAAEASVLNQVKSSSAARTQMDGRRTSAVAARRAASAACAVTGATTGVNPDGGLGPTTFENPEGVASSLRAAGTPGAASSGRG